MSLRDVIDVRNLNGNNGNIVNGNCVLIQNFIDAPMLVSLFAVKLSDEMGQNLSF